MRRWRSTRNGGGRSTTRKNGGRADERGRATAEASVVLVPPGLGRVAAKGHPREAEAETAEQSDDEGLRRPDPARSDRAPLGRRPTVRAELGSRSRRRSEERRVTP